MNKLLNFEKSRLENIVYYFILKKISIEIFKKKKR